MEPKRPFRTRAATAWLRAALLVGLTALACLAARSVPLVPGADAWPWPAAGIAFGAGWRWGRRWALPCAVGASLGLMPDPAVGVVAGLAVALGALAGLTLLRIVEDIDPAPDRVRGELQWLTAAVCVSAPVQAVVAGLARPWTAGYWPGAWFDIWLAGALGIALIAPLVGPMRLPARWRAARAGSDAAPSGRPPRPSQRPMWLKTISATLLVACVHVLLLASGEASGAQTLLVAFVPIAAIPALRAPSRAAATALALSALVLLAAHRVGVRLAAGDLPDGGQLAAVLLCAVTVARLLQAVATERRAALDRLALQAEHAAATSALDPSALAAELETRLAAPGRCGFGLIGVQLAGAADCLPGEVAAAERAIAVLLARHPEALLTARLAADRHVVVVAADSVVQLRATARELYSQIGRVGNSPTDGERAAGGALRASIGGLLIEPTAAIDAEDCLGALADAIALAGSVRDPRLFVEPLSQTMIDARRAHRDKIEQVREAIRHARLELHAQPLDDLDCRSERMEYEILTRLRDRDGGLIAPAEFLPLAAHARLSGALDRAVVQRAFEWLAQRPAALARTAKCSINLSEASVGDPEFAAYARAQRLAHGIAAGKIVFEIAEGDVLRDPVAASRLVDELKADGFGIALDDFGRGLATFEYLRRFPLDYLKIDGTFIRNLATSPIDEEIVLSMIRVARRLSVKTVAEHVHSERVLERLRRLGVDHVQGALIGAPRPLQELFEMGRPHGPGEPDELHGDASGRAVRAGATG